METQESDEINNKITCHTLKELQQLYTTLSEINVGKIHWESKRELNILKEMIKEQIHKLLIIK